MPHSNNWKKSHIHNPWSSWETFTTHKSAGGRKQQGVVYQHWPAAKCTLSCSLTYISQQNGEKMGGETSWVKKNRHRLLTNYHHQQGRLNWENKFNFFSIKIDLSIKKLTKKLKQHLSPTPLHSSIPDSFTPLRGTGCVGNGTCSQILSLSLPLLPLHTFSLLQCGSSPQASDLQEKSAIVWPLHRPQFLWEIFNSSTVGSSMGCRGKSAPSTIEHLLPLLLLWLRWPWIVSHFFFFFLSSSSHVAFLPFLKFVFTEVSPAFLTGLTLACGWSVAELARSGCV